MSSPGNSPQLGSPGHLPPSHHQSQMTHFGFNSGTIGVMGSLAGLPSSAGSPGGALPTPTSPSHVSIAQPPPPLPPRCHRRRESSISESPQQVKLSTCIVYLIVILFYFFFFFFIRLDKHPMHQYFHHAKVHRHHHHHYHRAEICR